MYSNLQSTHAASERQIRLMTNSHKWQSEKLAAGGGRETAAKKPYNNEVPGPHHYRDARTWAAGAGAKAPTPYRARARDRDSSEEA